MPKRGRLRVFCRKSSSLVVLRFRIRVYEEKANLSRSGHSPDMGIPFRRARLEKSPIELTTEDVNKSTALALHKGIPYSVNSLSPLNLLDEARSEGCPFNYLNSRRLNFHSL